MFVKPEVELIFIIALMENLKLIYSYLENYKEYDVRLNLGRIRNCHCPWAFNKYHDFDLKWLF